MAKLDGLFDGEYPRITKRLDLGGYDKKFRGNYLEIWMNWSRDFNDRADKARSELNRVRLATSEDTQELLRKTDAALGAEDGMLLRAYIYDDDDSRVEALENVMDEMFEISAEFWGCTVDEVRSIWDLDVNLWQWCQTQSAESRNAWRDARKKGTNFTGDS